ESRSKVSAGLGLPVAESESAQARPRNTQPTTAATANIRIPHESAGDRPECRSRAVAPCTCGAALQAQIFERLAQPRDERLDLRRAGRVGRILAERSLHLRQARAKASICATEELLLGLWPRGGVGALDERLRREEARMGVVDQVRFGRVPGAQ